MKKVLNMLSVAAISAATALGINYFTKQDKAITSAQIVSAPTRLVSLADETDPRTSVDFTNAADMSVHAVVHVKTSYMAENTANYYYYDPFRDFFGGGQPQQQQPVPQKASGSGVIISPDGYIMTNNHVVDKAETIEITLNDKRTYTAHLIGKDPTTDLALLKIKEKDLPCLSYGNSDEVKIGEWVLAVGNPFNLMSTVTAGIVSAKGRNINAIANDPDKGQFPIESFIQTDAAVNPGNSGGALVDTHGRLIGINTAIASNTGSYTGYSFAIPVNIVRKVAADIMEYGEVQRAFIGVNIRDIDSQLADEKKISVMKGVYVNSIIENGASADAGINEGDVVTKIGDVDVNNVSELQEQVSRYRPGDKLIVTVRRGDSEKVFTLVLRNQSGNTDVVKKEKPIKVFSALGASFRELSADEMKHLNIACGLKIDKLNAGKLRSAGINEGFIITSVDKKKITSPDDLKEALENKKGGVLIEGVYPNGMRAYYAFGI